MGQGFSIWNTGLKEKGFIWFKGVKKFEGTVQSLPVSCHSSRSAIDVERFPIRSIMQIVEYCAFDCFCWPSCFGRRAKGFFPCWKGRNCVWLEIETELLLKRHSVFALNDFVHFCLFHGLVSIGNKDLKNLHTMYVHLELIPSNFIFTDATNILCKPRRTI